MAGVTAGVGAVRACAVEPGVAGRVADEDPDGPMPLQATTASADSTIIATTGSGGRCERIVTGRRPSRWAP